MLLNSDSFPCWNEAVIFMDSQSKLMISVSSRNVLCGLVFPDRCPEMEVSCILRMVWFESVHPVVAGILIASLSGHGVTRKQEQHTTLRLPRLSLNIMNAVS